MISLNDSRAQLSEVLMGSRQRPSPCRARVWIVDRNLLIEQVAGRLTRNLTEQEWRRFFRDEPYRKTRADLP